MKIKKDDFNTMENGYGERGGFPQNGFEEAKKPEKPKSITIIIAAVIIVLVVAIGVIIGIASEGAGIASLIVMIPMIIAAMLASMAIPGAMIAGGVWFIVGYPKKLMRKRERCTQVVSAVVADYEKVEKRERDSDGKERTVTYYFAIYDYEFNGFSFHTKTDEPCNKASQRGAQAKLCINPEYPTEIYEIEKEYEKIKNAKRFGIILIVVGVIFLLGTFISGSLGED